MCNQDGILIGKFRLLFLCSKPNTALDLESNPKADHSLQGSAWPKFPACISTCSNLFSLQVALPWPYCCSSNMPTILLPQDLGIGYSIFLEESSSGYLTSIIYSGNFSDIASSKMPTFFEEIKYPLLSFSIPLNLCCFTILITSWYCIHISLCVYYLPSSPS